MIPAAASMGATSSDEYGHLPALQQQIVNFICSQLHNKEGVHVAATARAVKADAHNIQYVHPLHP